MKAMLAAVLGVLILTGTASANLIYYSFRASPDLAGSFVLDDAGTLTITGTAAHFVLSLTSPSQTITGRLGAYTFEGPVMLLIGTGPTFFGTCPGDPDNACAENQAPDRWSIFGPTISGSEINGIRPTTIALHLLFAPGAFFGGGPSGNGLILNPPCCSRTNTQGVVFFSDGSIAQGELDAMTIPEGSTLLLQMVGVCVLMVAHRVIAGSERRAHRARWGSPCQRSPHSEPLGSGKLSHPGSPIGSTVVDA